MDKLRELREQQASLATNARAKLDEITDETPEGRAQEIESEFDRMMADWDSLEAKIDREQKLSHAEERVQAGDPRRPSPDVEGRQVQPEEKTPEYKEVFSKAIRFGASELEAEERDVLMRHRDELPQEVRAQSVGTDSAGGYTVPTDFSGEIDRAMAMWGPMWDASIVRELNTGNGRRIEWPTVDDTANTGRIKAENASVNDDGGDDVSFGQKVLDAYVYDTGMVRIPMELLQDSFFNIESLMNDLFGERLGRLANNILTTGDGTDKPQGIVPASSQGKEATSATALDADEIIDLLHSVDPAYRSSPQARWMFNDTTLAAIRKLKDGQGNYLWQMGDVRVGEPAQILGHPYSVNQAMAAPEASSRPILFGDMSRYVVRKVMGFQVLTLRERYAENFQVGMVGFKRFDGELLNNAAVRHMAMSAS